MTTFSEFIAMGGYGFYVWTSWGITCVLMAFLVLRAVTKRRSILNSLSRRAQREHIQKK